MGEAAKRRAEPRAPRDPRIAFFGGPPSAEKAHLNRLHRLLDAAILTSSATGTLTLLYSYVQKCFDGYGWAEVLVPKSKLARERSVSARTLTYHLAALEALGVLRRNVEEHATGKPGSIWLRPLPSLIEHLEEQPAIKDELRRRFYEGDVTPIFGQPLPRVTHVPSHAPDEYFFSKPEDVVPESHYSKVAKLRQTVTTSYDDTKDVKDALAERRAQRPKKVKSQAPKAPPRTDTAPEVLKSLNDLVYHNFPNAIAIVGIDNLSRMRQLLDRHGEKDVRRVIEFTATPETWDRVKTIWPKIATWHPTPGVLLAWDESIFAWVKNGAPDMAPQGKKKDGGWKDTTTVKRSGGAEVYDSPSVDADGDDTF